MPILSEVESSRVESRVEGVEIGLSVSVCEYGVRLARCTYHQRRRVYDSVSSLAVYRICCFFMFVQFSSIGSKRKRKVSVETIHDGEKRKRNEKEKGKEGNRNEKSKE